MRLLSTIRADIRFQFRQGFYLVYGLASALYIILLRILPPGWRDDAAILVVFTDSSILGAFFIGGIMLLERAQRIHSALFVTPLRVYEYMLGKMISLSILALIASLVIVIGGTGIRLLNPLFVLGVVGSSALFTLAGIIVATCAATVNQYLLMSPIIGLPVLPSLLAYFGVLRSPAWVVLPTQPGLAFMSSAARGLPGWYLLSAGAVLIGYGIVLWFWALERLHRQIANFTGEQL